MGLEVDWEAGRQVANLPPFACGYFSSGPRVELGLLITKSGQTRPPFLSLDINLLTNVNGPAAARSGARSAPPGRRFPGRRRRKTGNGCPHKCARFSLR